MIRFILVRQDENLSAPIYPIELKLLLNDPVFLYP